MNEKRLSIGLSVVVGLALTLLLVLAANAAASSPGAPGAVVAVSTSGNVTLSHGFWRGVRETGYTVYLPLVLRNH